jgi:hypothetical protein
MAAWVIKEDGGQWSVTQGRIREEFPTQDAALRYVRDRCRRGDKILQEEADGYRIPINPRRHWRG